MKNLILLLVIAGSLFGQGKKSLASAHLYSNGVPTTLCTSSAQYGTIDIDYSLGGSTYVCTSSGWKKTGGAILVTDTGTANAYVGCPTAGSAPTNGLSIYLSVLNANTGASTYNHCGSGAVSIKTSDGQDPLASAMNPVTSSAPNFAHLTYSSTASKWQLENPATITSPFPTQSNITMNKDLVSNGAAVSFKNTRSPDFRRRSTWLADGVTTSSSSLQGVAMGMIPVWQSGSGVPAANAPGSGTPTSLSLPIAASASSQSYWQTSQALWRVGRNLSLDVRTSISATTDLRLWLALTTNDNSSAGADTLSGSMAAFRFSTLGSDPAIMCVVANGGTATATSSGVSIGTGSRKYRIMMDDTTPTVLFFIDDTQVCTGMSMTNYPAVANLRPMMFLMTGTGTANTWTLSYVSVESDY